MQGYENSPLIDAFHLDVDETHSLYIEEVGNPEGTPILFLHGGPGGGISEKSRVFFHPQKYRLILFDQRGSGRSTPFLSLENNTVLDSVSDIEKIREYYGFEKWFVFGGSYGSTLALSYAIHFPERVSGLILRGIFLGRQFDIDWLFNGGAGLFYPEEFARFEAYIPVEEQDDLVAAYYKRMRSHNTVIRDEACKRWSDWESSITTLVPEFVDYAAPVQDHELSLGLLEAHYFANRMFWYEDNYILNRADKLVKIPIDIFHGRYDVDCVPGAAYDLKQALPHAKLNIIESSGHSAYEPELLKALTYFLDDMEV